MATPRASRPMIIPGMAKPKAERPYKRKNRIRHQVAIELGIFIFILLWVNNPGSASPLLK